MENIKIDLIDKQLKALNEEFIKVIGTQHQSNINKNYIFINIKDDNYCILSETFVKEVLFNKNDIEWFRRVFNKGASDNFIKTTFNTYE